MRKFLCCLGASMFLALQPAAASEALYSSPKMVGNQRAQEVDVAVKGVNYLHLTAEIATENNWNDHADWADAKLIDSAGNVTYLSDMVPLFKDQEWGSLQCDKSVGGEPITIGTQTFAKGLGTHANSQIVYQLDGKYERFSSFIGVDASQQEKGSIFFKLAGSDTFSNPAVVPTPRNYSWWYDQTKGFNTIAQQSDRIDIVFLGDSITQGWRDVGKTVWDANYAGRYAVNFGIGGDRTENSLWRVFNGNFDGVIARTNPKFVVLMIGTNNSGSLEPSAIAEGVKANIDAIKQKAPLSRILLLAIFPRSQYPQDQPRLTVQNTNNIIQGFADNKTVFFLDIGPNFLEQNGTMSNKVMADYLHPTELGYQIWLRSMEPTLAKLLQ